MALFYACTTNKVPKGQYLLTKNNFKFTDGSVYSSGVSDYVSQKPNGKTLFIFPMSLWFYNMSNPKYDTILNKYTTYPSHLRNSKLRDTLSIRAGHPEYVGRSMLLSRMLHSIGKAPVILDENKTRLSANGIKKYLIYRGYWDTEVEYNIKKDSSAKKAQNIFTITHKDPTYISEYNHNIPYPDIRAIYEQNYDKSLIKKGDILNQVQLENEIKRITELMRAEGYYNFNSNNEEIFFTADTLQSRKQVPLTLEIKKDTVGGRYKRHTIGKIEIYIKDKPSDSTIIEKKIGDVTIRRMHRYFKSRPLWRAVTVDSGEVYNQSRIDLTRRNLLALDNFTIVNANPLTRRSREAPNDSILDLRYTLIPLQRYNLKLATDLHYSQILNFGISPSLEFTSRNIFRGGENLNLSFSGIIGTTGNEKGKFFNAYETSAEVSLKFPRFISPFRMDKIIPRRFSPSSSITFGASVQNNIGLGRINFNGGINYFLNVNDVVSHRFTLLNSLLSITRNKDNYYDLFPSDKIVRDYIFSLYQSVNPTLVSQFYSGNVTSDAVSRAILDDHSFMSGLSVTDLYQMSLFEQSLINKERQTQDVIIFGLNYNFLYNELGKKYFKHPFYFNAKFELSGNTLSLLDNIFKFERRDESIIHDDAQRSIFGTVYSQFAKLDLDIRKYFNFNDGRQTLVLRQFIGIGLPYGNSRNMPFARSYYNGGSNDIRAWKAYGGLGPSDSQLNENIRTYMMGNMKLTTNIEYRFIMNNMFHGAVFTDLGNTWSIGGEKNENSFKITKFYKQMGIGSGFGIRMNIAYVTFRLDFAYKVYDPNRPEGQKWVASKINLLDPTINFAIGYPF